MGIVDRNRYAATAVRGLSKRYADCSGIVTGFLQVLESDSSMYSDKVVEYSDETIALAKSIIAQASELQKQIELLESQVVAVIGPVRELAFDPSGIPTGEIKNL